MLNTRGLTVASDPRPRGASLLPGGHVSGRLPALAANPAERHWRFTSPGRLDGLAFDPVDALQWECSNARPFPWIGCVSFSTRLNSFAAITAFLFIQCGDIQPVGYIVYVQSIEVPESVHADDRLDVTLHGMVGPNGCFRVSHLETARSSGTLEVTVIGVRDVGPTVVCTDEIAVLDEKITVNPPFDEDVFVIWIHQPDGSSLRERVSILE